MKELKNAADYSNPPHFYSGEEPNVKPSDTLKENDC
jgi:hypothetical protein